MDRRGSLYHAARWLVDLSAWSFRPWRPMVNWQEWAEDGHVPDVSRGGFGREFSSDVCKNSRNSASRWNWRPWEAIFAFACGLSDR